MGVGRPAPLSAGDVLTVGTIEHCAFLLSVRITLGQPAAMQLIALATAGFLHLFALDMACPAMSTTFP